MMEALSFDDVVILPTNRYHNPVSRTDILKTLPRFIMNAPMSSVIGDKNADAFSRVVIPTVPNWRTVDVGRVAFSSIRLSDLSANTLMHAMRTCDYLLIDMANGHDVASIARALSRSDDYFDRSKVMVGNVATEEGFAALQRIGVGFIRVGIGCGGTCLTTYNTGIGCPTFQSVLDANKSKTTAKIVADGGMRSPGDVCKALCAGADYVMLGSYFAGCKETPNGETGTVAHFGEASAHAKGKDVFIEGAMGFVPVAEDNIATRVRRIEEGVASCISYLGYSSWAEFLENRSVDVQFRRVTTLGRQEHYAHRIS